MPEKKKVILTKKVSLPCTALNFSRDIGKPVDFTRLCSVYGTNRRMFMTRDLGFGH